MGILHVDIDDVRTAIFGLEEHPKPDPTLVDLSPIRKLDQLPRKLSYKAILFFAEKFSELGKSVIISATFSQFETREKLRSIAKTNGAELKLIKCEFLNDTKEEVEKRIASRQFGKNSLSLIVNYDQYLWQKSIEKPFQENHFLIDTSHSPEICLKKALEYINSD